MKKKLWIIPLFFLSVLPMQAQSTYWDLQLAGSWMTPNNFNMLEYSALTLDGAVGWWYRCEGDEWWVKKRRNPSFGLRASFAYIPQGIAGHRIGLVGYVSTPLWRLVDYHIGVGLSGYTRSHCFTHEEENIFITTWVSCLIDVGFDYNLTERLSLSASLLHSSNGMLHRPNKGLNFLQLGVAYKLAAVPRDTVVRLLSEPLFPHGSRHEVGWTLQGGGVMSRDVRQKGHYPCYDLSFNYQYYLNPIFAAGGTLDLWYNGSHYGLSRLYGERYKFPCYVSALGYFEGFWGPLSIKAGIGPVLIAPPRVNIKFYERVGVYYNFGRNYVGVSLNAHAGMIEFIELAYGYRIAINRPPLSIFGLSGPSSKGS